MSDNRLFSIVERIPKAELHVHIEGTLEPEMMLNKASKNEVKLPYKSINDVKKAYRFADLQSFLNLYYLGVSSIVDREDFYDLAMAYFRKASSQNIRRAEVFFDPQAHTRRGIDFSTVINGLHDAVVDAQNRYNISIGLIMSFLRDLPEESAMQTLEEAMQYRKWILGVGLDSKELGNPPEKFERVFRKARDEGFIAVAHAGEEGPAEYVWSTIKLLKVARVDHGYHMFEDQELIKYIANNKIPVTLCPLAAVGVKYFNNIVDFPLIKALNSGIIVSINSDDPAFFGGYINQNYSALQAAFKLSDKKITELAMLSVVSSFMDEQGKQKIINEINTLS